VIITKNSIRFLKIYSHFKFSRMDIRVLGKNNENMTNTMSYGGNTQRHQAKILNWLESA